MGKRTRMRGSHKKSRVPDWVRARVNEKKRTITVKLEIAGFLEEAEVGKHMTFVIRPKTFAKEGPGPYDYMLELQIGNLVLPGPLNVFFPDETTHGKEFFEKVKRMLGEAGVLPKLKGLPSKRDTLLMAANTVKSRRKCRQAKDQHCSICKHARWPRDKRSIGKCIEPGQDRHSHCAEVWPDGKMKIKARWGSACPQFEKKS